MVERPRSRTWTRPFPTWRSCHADHTHNYLVPTLLYNVSLRHFVIATATSPIEQSGSQAWREKIKGKSFTSYGVFHMISIQPERQPQFTKHLRNRPPSAMLSMQKRNSKHQKHPQEATLYASTYDDVASCLRQLHPLIPPV